MIDIALQGSASSYRGIEHLIASLERSSKIHFATLSLHEETELSIVLTDDEHIQSLNLEWNGEDGPTDVLSFPQFQPGEIPDFPAAIGDIVISLPYAEKTLADSRHKERIEASLQRPVSEWTFEDELHFLLIHGLLHLAGYDHFDEASEQEMMAKERELWEQSHP